MSKPQENQTRTPFTPRGMSRVIASCYIGVSASKFDQMVKDGRMPQPKRIDGRVLWDRLALDAAFESLPSAANDNPWDDAPGEAS